MKLSIRTGALAIAAIIVLSACSTGDDAKAPATTVGPTSVTTGSSDVGGAGPAPVAFGDTTTTVATDANTAVPQIDGPTAPDFDFLLSDGSSFSLAGEEKPVYLVFWAEW